MMQHIATLWLFSAVSLVFLFPEGMAQKSRDENLLLFFKKISDDSKEQSQQLRHHAVPSTH
ncbi:hypothetical protein SEVIR_8G226883v4 [Setaria viridis]